MFIVVEGDNGTGKTTIGRYLKEKGYLVITDEQGALVIEQDAKRQMVGSQERFKAFLKYNEFVGSHVNKAENVVAIRYWFSTIAASFADGPLSLNEALSISNTLYQSLPKPDYVFVLTCKYSLRVSRIENRKFISGDKQDDISLSRDKKYKTILEKLSNRISGWHILDTSYQTPEQVFDEIWKRIA